MDARTRTTARAKATVAVVLAVVALLVATGMAVLAATSTPAEAQCAPSLVVSKTAGLAADGETVTVSGSCYDVNKGVYVAFCVVPPPESVPSPCGGGVDMSGAGGLSHWISSNPPPQGAGLTSPYGPGGSFTVTMRPSAALNATVDCRRVRCAVVTRNDHTRSSDRSQDVIVPVSFAADPAPAPPTTAPAPVFVPPPTEAPTTVPETTTTTTTVAAEDPAAAAVAVTETTIAAVPFDDGATDELAADTASADGGGPSGGLIGAVVGIVVLAAAAGGWLLLRRRPAGLAGGTDGTDGPGGAG